MYSIQLYITNYSGVAISILPINPSEHEYGWVAGFSSRARVQGNWGLRGISPGTAVQACPNSWTNRCQPSFPLYTGLTVCFNSYISQNSPFKPAQQSSLHPFWYPFSYDSLLTEKILKTGNEMSVGVVSASVLWDFLSQGCTSWLIILSGYIYF